MEDQLLNRETHSPPVEQRGSCRVEQTELIQKLPAPKTNRCHLHSHLLHIYSSFMLPKTLISPILPPMGPFFPFSPLYTPLMSTEELWIQLLHHESESHGRGLTFCLLRAE